MNRLNSPIRALIIASPHIDRILTGEKTWEMRSKSCRFRETIGLIRKGSGQVVALVDIVDTKGPLTSAEMLANQDKHRIAPERLRDRAVAKWNIAWVLANLRPLNVPVPYHHPNGAQSWIRLDEKARFAIAAQF